MGLVILGWYFLQHRDNSKSTWSRQRCLPSSRDLTRTSYNEEEQVESNEFVLHFLNGQISSFINQSAILRVSKSRPKSPLFSA
jgi:hypothetical protein